MKTIYISGKIKDLPLDIAKNNFEFARIVIEEAGHTAINPFDVDPYIMEDIEDDESRKVEYDEYMRGDCIELCKCDSIYMLNNWQDSNGAKGEIRLAIDLNLEIIFQEPKKL